MSSVPFLSRNLRPINPSPYAGPAFARPSPSPTQTVSTVNVSPYQSEKAALQEILHSLHDAQDPKLFQSTAQRFVSDLRKVMDKFSKDPRFVKDIITLQDLFLSLDRTLKDLTNPAKSEGRTHQAEIVLRDARRVCRQLSSMHRTSTATTRSILEGTTLVSSNDGHEHGSLLANRLPSRIIRTDLNILRPTGPHSFRNSAFYFPMDILSSTHDVIMPLPTGHAAQYTYDKHGQIKSASYHALVCLLTSRQGVQDHELSDIFMRFFRTFGPPAKFLSALIQRYNSECPSDLSLQQRRVWEDNLPRIRIRVGTNLLNWLRNYWRDEDDEVLRDMNAFVLSTFPKGSDLRTKLAQHINEKLKRSKALPPLPLRTFLSSSTMTFCGSTLLDYDVDSDPPEASSRTDLLSFLSALSHNTEHRAILAHHITNIFTHKFYALDHLLVVQLWRLARPPPMNQLGRSEPGEGIIPLAERTPERMGAGGIAFARKARIPEGLKLTRETEKHRYLLRTAEAVQEIHDLALSLTLCVCHSIIEPTEHDERTKRIAFWTNIASRCIDLRNFIASRAILDGITHVAVTRLRRTIHRLPEFDNEVLFGLCRRLGIRKITSFRPFTKPVGAGFDDYTEYSRELRQLEREDAKAAKKRNQNLGKGQQNAGGNGERERERELITLPLLRVLNDEVYYTTRPPWMIADPEPNSEMIHLQPYRVMRTAILALERSSSKHPPPPLHRCAQWFEAKLKELYSEDQEPSQNPTVTMLPLQHWLCEESQKREKNESAVPFVSRHGWVDHPNKK